MAHKSHDGLDWAARLASLRMGDELNAEEHHEIAAALIRPETQVVIEIGSGAGGMAAAFATALAEFDGGTVVLLDAAAELLEAAAELARSASGDRVRVVPVLGDASSEASLKELPNADLVWAGHVVHHLPDQQRGVRELAGLLAPGGRLALAEGGLQLGCLPWDLGVGEPGLADRLEAARAQWFREMRGQMPGVVRMPYGWSRALTEAGLVEVTAFSSLVDHPAPPSKQVQQAVVERIGWLREVTDSLLDESDRSTLDRLLDENDPAYLGDRDDSYWLRADTIHLGTAPTP